MQNLKLDPPQMKGNEASVIASVAKAFSGAWRPGENSPDAYSPDAYLTIGSRVIAVEISTLTQYVTDDRGTRSRFTDDKLAFNLANELNAELHELVPFGDTIFLVLTSPISEPRKTKTALAKWLREKLTDAYAFAIDTKTEINGNVITISRKHNRRPQHKRISGIVSHRRSNADPISNADLLRNARYILEDRIIVKAKKCAGFVGRSPLWLALFNDYSLIDVTAYKSALSFISAAHPFEKILLVNGNCTLEPIFEL
jgi:hypothetical protein